MACIVGGLAFACTHIAPPAPTRLASPIDNSSVAQVQAAISLGERMIDLGDWSRPAHVGFVSGGDIVASRHIASLMKQQGIAARCVGFCGSALAEILLGSGHCIVTPQAQVMLHLAFVPDGTPEQNRIAEVETITWWFLLGLPSADFSALLTKIAGSPTKSWLMRDDELRAAGCAT